MTLAHNNDLGIGRVMQRQMDGLLDTPAAAVAQQNIEALPFAELRRYSGPAHVAPSAPLDRRAAFAQRLSPFAEQTAARLGVPARAMLAQAALESGWGQHVIRDEQGRSSHNYFGIKAGADWQGEVVTVSTTEYIGGRAVTVEADFRAYPGPAEAFDDYAGFIGDNPRYREVLAAGHNSARFAEELAAAGYATDPRYAEKIIAIIETGALGPAATPTVEAL